MSIEAATRPFVIDQAERIAAQAWDQNPAQSSTDECNYRGYNAPGAQQDAIDFKNQGRAIIDKVLANEGNFTPIVRARARMNAFVLISGRSGTNELSNITTASTGIYLGEEKPDGQIRAELLGAVMAQGMNAELKRYGKKKDKFLIFVRDEYSPREMLNRLVEAPGVIYKTMPGINKGFYDLQEKRREELLRGDRGQVFEDIYYGRVNPLVSPLVESVDSLVFGWENDGVDFTALDPSKKPFKMRNLRLNTPDKDGETDIMLEDKENFFSEGGGWIIEISGAPDVECCITTMNALHFINNFVLTPKRIDMKNAPDDVFVFGDEVIAKYSNGEFYSTKDFCGKCHAYSRKGDVCSCPKENPKES